VRRLTPAMPATARKSTNCSPTSTRIGRARCRRLQRQLSHARPLRRSRSGGSRQVHLHHRLRRLSGRAGRRAPHAAERHGAILLTGASAGVKGYPQSAPFAMGKFALRGLSQSMARELQPQGIHVCHFVIDGGIKSARRAEPSDNPDSLLDPDAIAASYWHVLQQRAVPGRRNLNCGPL